MLTSSMVVLTATERVTLGTPAAEAVAAEADRLGAKRVFVLASSFLRRQTEEIGRIEAALGERHGSTYDGIRSHVPRIDVINAANAARDIGTDLVVTVGGGSVTDAGKLVTLCLKHDIRTPDQFEPYRMQVTDTGAVIFPDFAGPDVRAICVPTTLSGGEFNPLSGSLDEVANFKGAYEQRMMAPVSIVLDPAITVHTPEWLWLSTGVRAIDHAVETLASLRSNDFCDGMADSALRLLVESLPRVKADPGDLEARLKCQVGVWQSAIPMIAGVPFGASHAIGHVLGGSCGVAHGYTSCVMSPYVLDWNVSVNRERQKRISAGLGAPDVPASILLDQLIRSLGMPRTLREVGLREEQLQMVAEKTLEDFWGRTNPRPIRGADDVLAILKTAMG